MPRLLMYFFILLPGFLDGKIQLGTDRLFDKPYIQWVKNKRVAIITNQTGTSSKLESVIDIVKRHHKDCTLKALFAPEHGLHGALHSGDHISHQQGKIPVYSLHDMYAVSRKPTRQMTQDVDVFIFDIQDTGVRSYSFLATLCYLMEALAEIKKPLIILDRPNPLGGDLVDGPGIDGQHRTTLGYLNVPYCHGMTMGEVAQFYNQEYKIGCDIKIVPMGGWKRWMRFDDLKLQWIPTSPNIPTHESSFYYATTSFLAQLSFVSVGIGSTLPFKVFGAPWLESDRVAQVLNFQNIPGAKFVPIAYKPYYGMYAKEECKGVMILIDDPKQYQPMFVQAFIFGALKQVHQKQLKAHLKAMSKTKKELFYQVTGSKKIFDILLNEKYPAWPMIDAYQKDLKQFIKKRKPYLIADYS